MKKTLLLLSLGAVSVVSANQYYYQSYGQPSYGYYQDGYSDGYYGSQPQYYYQGSSQGYYSQPYYQDQNYQYGGQTYHQAPSQATPYYQQYQTQPYQGSRGYGYSSPAGNVNVQYQQSGNNADRDLESKVRDIVGAGWFSSGYEGVSFQINNGVVTLRGNVETAEDKRKIEEKVRDLNGVTQVNNQIVVSGKRDADSPRYQSSSVNTYDNNPNDNRYMRDNRGTYDNRTYDNRSYTEDGSYSDDRSIRNDRAYNDSNANPQDYAATDADRQLNAKIRDKLKGGWFGPDYSLLIVKTSNGFVTLVGTVERPDDAQKAADSVKKIEGVKGVNNQLNVKNNK